MTDESLSSKIKTWDAEWEEQNRALDIRDVREAVKKLKEKMMKQGNLSHRIVETEEGEFEHKHDLVLNNIVCEYIDEIFGMIENICGNCGHEYDWHVSFPDKNYNVIEGRCRSGRCPCVNFVPSNQSSEMISKAEFEKVLDEIQFTGDSKFWNWKGETGWSNKPQLLIEELKTRLGIK